MDTGIVHDVPYFDRFAPLYDLVLPETDSQPLEAGLAQGERTIECVLDLGGGTGRAARVLSDSTMVLDGSYPMLAKARSHDLPSVQGDVRHLPLRDESVDGVVSVDAVHHFPSVPAVVAEAARVLRPGGALVIREFDPTTLRGRGLVFGERVIGFDSRFYPPDAIRSMMTKVGLQASIEETGFVYTVVGVKRREPSAGEGGEQGESSNVEDGERGESSNVEGGEQGESSNVEGGEQGESNTVKEGEPRRTEDGSGRGS